MSDLEIGNKYSLSLSNSFAGVVTLDNVTLKGKLDLSLAIVITNVVEEYEQVYHSLPDELKEITLSNETWYYFTTFEQEDTIVVPGSFILNNTIVPLTSIIKTMRIDFSSRAEYTRMINYLTDNSIQYTDV